MIHAITGNVQFAHHIGRKVFAHHGSIVVISMDIYGFESLVGLVVYKFVEVYTERLFSGASRGISLKTNGGLFYGIGTIVYKGYGIPAVVPKRIGMLQGFKIAFG